MALGSKSLHCVLLALHLFMMITALSVLVVSSLSLAELMDKRSFVEGKYKSKPTVKSEVEVWPPVRIIDSPDEKKDETEEEGSPQGTLTGPAILLVAVATATLLLSSFAFYSTLKMNIRLLRAFIALMAVALALQVSSGIWAFVARSRSMESIRTSLIRQMTEYEASAEKGGGVAAPRGASRGKALSPVTTLWTNPWNALQWEMKCCGIEGPDDYFVGYAIPLSCCSPAGDAEKEKAGVQGVDTPPPPATPAGFSCHTIKRKGCLESLDGYVRDRLLWVGIFAIAATFVEVIPLMLTVAYSMSIKRELQRIYQ